MHNLKILMKEGRELLKRARNRRKGNPYPKIHLNYNIKNERKTGPRTYWGKLKSSLNSRKHGRRASENSMFSKEVEKLYEIDFLRFMIYYQDVKALSKEEENRFRT